MDSDRLFLLQRYRSEEAFILEYNKRFNTKKERIRLYHSGLSELHELIKRGNFDGFVKLLDTICLMRSEITKPEYFEICNNEQNPLKGTNLVIEICKFGSSEALKVFFSVETPFNTFNVAGTEVSPNDKDYKNHNAFYYAIKRENTEMIDILLEEWPGNDTIFMSLEDALSEAFELLRVRNVLLSDKMKSSIMNELIKFRFDQSYTGLPQRTLERILDRIELLKEEVEMLALYDYHNSNTVDDMFVYLCKCIAYNIIVLKKLLSCTYNLLPWEEIEYCLVTYITSQDLYYKNAIFIWFYLNHDKIINYVTYFMKCLSEIMLYKDIFNNELSGNREEHRANILNLFPKFQELFKDFQNIRDISSLELIGIYLGLLSRADGDSLEGRLAMSRSLQVVAEHLKDTPQSPKISRARGQAVLDALGSEARGLVVQIRDSQTQHQAISLVSSGRDFQAVQNGLGDSLSTLVGMLADIKLRIVCQLLETIVKSEDEDEVRRAFSWVSRSEIFMIQKQQGTYLLNIIRKLVTHLDKSLNKKSEFEMYVIEDVLNMIKTEESRLSFVLENFRDTNIDLLELSDNTFSEIKTLKNISRFLLRQLMPIEDHAFNVINDIKEYIEKFLENEWLFLKMDYPDSQEALRLYNLVFKKNHVVESKMIEKFKKSNLHSERNVKTEEAEYYDLEVEVSEIEGMLNVIDSSKDNEVKEAALEMLFMKILSKSSQNNYFLFLDDYFPILAGKNLYDHLFHLNMNITYLDRKRDINLLVRHNLEYIINEPPYSYGRVKFEIFSVLRKKYLAGLREVEKLQRAFEGVKVGNMRVLRGLEVEVRDKRGRSLLQVADERTGVALLATGLGPWGGDGEGRTALGSAALRGLAELVGQLIAAGAVDCPDDSGLTALHLAARAGHLAVVRLLIRHAALQVPCRRGLTPGHHAIIFNRPPLYRAFHDYSNHNNPTNGNLSPLHIASIYGHVDFIEILLEENTDINVTSKDGKTPLHFATIFHHNDIVKHLILNGADINTRTNGNCTALMLAICFENIQGVQILLECGCEVTNDALTIAIQNGNIATLRLLLEKVSDVRRLDIEDEPLLHVAARTGRSEMILFLLEKGLPINARRAIDGYSPLHEALHYNQISTAKILMREGADVNSHSNKYLTPLHIAASRNLETITKELILYDANINCLDKFGRSSLHMSCMNGNYSITKMLLNSHSDVNLMDNSNKTPLYYAVKRDCIGTIMILIKYGADIDTETEWSFYRQYKPLEEAISQQNKFVINLFVCLKAAVSKEDLLLAKDKSIISILLSKNPELKECFEEAAEHSLEKGYPDEVVNFYLTESFDNTGKSTNTGTLLERTSRLGLFESTKTLLKAGASVNWMNEEGLRPLHHAAEGGFLQVVKLLISQGAEVNCCDPAGVTPMYLAAEHGHLEIVSVLLQEEANPSIYKVSQLFKDETKETFGNKHANSYGVTPLYVAMVNGHADVAKLLIDKEPDSKKLRYIYYPFKTSSSKKHLEIIKICLRFFKLKDIVRRDSAGNTLLHFLSVRDDREAIEYLIKEGADLNCTNNGGLKPIHTSAASGSLKSLKFFLSSGCKINDNTDLGDTLLHAAAGAEDPSTSKARLQVIEYLVGQGVDINSRNKNGSTPMHLAAAKGDYSIAKFLLNRGAIYNAEDSLGKTPLDVSNSTSVHKILANTEQFFKAVKHFSVLHMTVSLILNGVPINSKNSKNKTVLHYVSWKGNIELVSYFLKNGADPNLADHKGFTPLHYAAKFSHRAVLYLLLAHGASFNSMSKSGLSPIDLASGTKIHLILEVVNDAFREIRNGSFRKWLDTIKQIWGLDDYLKLILVLINTTNRNGEKLSAIANNDNYKTVELNDVINGMEVIALCQTRSVEEAQTAFQD